MAQNNILTKVFIVQHSYEKDGCDETKFIGVYETLEKANEAVDRLKLKSGFCDRPNDFFIDKYKLNEDHWTSGFSTITSINIKKNDGTWESVHASILKDDLYQIVINFAENENEYEFQADDIVKCEEREVDGNFELYAIELVEKAKKR